MAPLLNKFILVFLVFVSLQSIAQSDVNGIHNPQDYKNGDQFKNFNKRRQNVAKWQINKLKNGALMVRLASNKKTIEILRKNKQEDLATQKEHETFAVNKNIVRAFTKYYNFSKVYFFYSHSSDTLLKGARQGFFLDTNLMVDPTINYVDSFYVIAEKDNAYNSSLGFVTEDTAKFVFETGNAAKEMGIVTKNKYGHQLKEPFPFSVIARGSAKAESSTYIQFIRPGTKLPAGEIGALPKIKVNINKKYSYEKYEAYVQNYNEGLLKFYYTNKGYEVSDPDIKPFLY